MLKNALELKEEIAKEKLERRRSEAEAAKKAEVKHKEYLQKIYEVQYPEILLSISASIEKQERSGQAREIVFPSYVSEAEAFWTNDVHEYVQKIVNKLVEFGYSVSIRRRSEPCAEYYVTADGYGTRDSGTYYNTTQLHIKW